MYAQSFKTSKGPRKQWIFEDAPMYYPVDPRFSQSHIWTRCESIHPIGTNFTYGIEDQQGKRFTPDVPLDLAK
jgi:hypothetical protein